jgi:hypothetical protein
MIRPIEEHEKIAFDPLVLCQKVLGDAKASPMETKLQNVFEQIKGKPESLVAWAQDQYSKCIAMMSDTVKPNEKTTTKQWTEFYSVFYQYTLSPVYFDSLKTLFHQNELNAEQIHFAASVLMEIYNQLLQKERSCIPEAGQPEASTSQTKLMSAGGRGKVRYVGAMCIAKDRYHLKNFILNNLYKPKEKANVSKARKKLEMLDELIIQYEQLSQETTDIESLTEIERKQNVRHSLLHINDKCTTFFMLVTHCIQSTLTQENLSIHKGELVDHVMDSIYVSNNITSAWIDLFPNQPEFLINELLKPVLDRYVKVNVKQFRKDMIDSLNLIKKEAHRKAVLKKAENVKLKATKILFKDIQQDQSEKKSVSHLKLQVAIMEKQDVFNTPDFTKKQLQCLCEGYDIDYAQEETKKLLNDKLVQTIQDSGLRSMINAVPDAPSTAPKKRKGKGKGKGKAKKHIILCVKCKEANEDEPWVQCDLCDEWWHRRCAEISDEVWETIQDSDEIWGCGPCTQYKRNKSK